MNKRKEKFTPGPWYCTCIGHIKECMGDPPKTVASIPGFCSEVKMDGITEKQANADLIAAAPEMYEMLDQFRRYIVEGPLGTRGKMYRSIDALLAKARGEAQG